MYTIERFSRKGVQPPYPCTHMGGPDTELWEMTAQEFLAYVAAEKEKQRLATQDHNQKWLTLLGDPDG